IHHVESPVLLFRSTIDNVVPPVSTSDAYDQLKTPYKQIKELTNSYHVASMDFDNDQIVEESIEFIKQHKGAVLSFS
ncbi:carboxylesterase, partial [Pseudomonas sp. 2822-17]|uniref:alpha/beta hydrolase n=1 Tax=Pseudomonas sp. 2822-17 TaxID=1712678 RepID=UPI000C54CA02